MPNTWTQPHRYNSILEKTPITLTTSCCRAVDHCSSTSMFPSTPRGALGFISLSHDLLEGSFDKNRVRSEIFGTRATHDAQRA